MYIGILFAAQPILHIGRIRVNTYWLRNSNLLCASRFGQQMAEEILLDPNEQLLINICAISWNKQNITYVQVAERRYFRPKIRNLRSRHVLCR
jgi:hypothetical protein